jgi:lambda repressor-like predicted transcriptional regulator
MNDMALFRELDLLKRANEQARLAAAHADWQFDSAATALHEAGFSVKQIAHMTGGSPASVTRTLNRDPPS